MSTFSHSRIETFGTCPRKYAFCYIEKAPRGPSGIEAFMGSRVHEALEWLYGEVRACREPSAEDVVARYERAWDDEWSDDVRVVREDRTAQDYGAIGEKALRAYHRRYEPFDQGITVGLEMRIALTLDPTHKLTGFIDRLVKVSEGVWEIHDYKTSQSLPTQTEADADRQLALYEIAIREMYPDIRDVTLVWHYLVFDQEIRSRRTPEQLADLRAGTLRRIEEIEAQGEFGTRVTRLCDWCDYRAACPAWSHLSAVAELLPDEFAEESGVALVDEYMRCSEEIKVLTERRNVVADAIARRADGEGLERLFGTEYVVSVKHAPCVALPDAKDPRRGPLEALLREAGAWDRYASLSCQALSRDVRDGVVPADLAERLEPFVERSTAVRLTTKKLD
jgi:putative RecB family exonuclease